MGKTGSLFGKPYIKMLYLAHITYQKNPNGLQMYSVKNEIIEGLKVNGKEFLKSCGGKAFFPHTKPGSCKVKQLI